MSAEPSGSRSEPAGFPPRARSDLEAHLHLDLHPGARGETRFDRAGSVVELPGGGLRRPTSRVVAHDRPTGTVGSGPVQTGTGQTGTALAPAASASLKEQLGS